jgi:hypothetical protein
MFHLAILVRPPVARSLRRVIERWRLTGAWTLVSEALYLRDPRARHRDLPRPPRDEWGTGNGELQMAVPLDLDKLAGRGQERRAGERHARRTTMVTCMRVADIRRRRGSTTGALGLGVMVRSYPGAVRVAGATTTTSAQHLESPRRPCPPEGRWGSTWELCSDRTRATPRRPVGETGPGAHGDGVLAGTGRTPRP